MERRAARLILAFCLAAMLVVTGCAQADDGREGQGSAGDPSTEVASQNGASQGGASTDDALPAATVSATVSADELTALIEDAAAGVLVIDVRTYADYTHGGHIDSAVSLPLAQLELRADELDGADTIVVVADNADNASEAAVAVRSLAPGEVLVLDGGMRQWRAQDLPLVFGAHGEDEPQC